MFAFLKIKLLPVEIAHRGSPQGSLNKFAWNERAPVNTDRDFPSVRYDNVSLCASLNKDGFTISFCRSNSIRYTSTWNVFENRCRNSGKSSSARLECNSFRTKYLQIEMLFRATGWIFVKRERKMFFFSKIGFSKERREKYLAKWFFFIHECHLARAIRHWTSISPRPPSGFFCNKVARWQFPAFSQLRKSFNSPVSNSLEIRFRSRRKE